MTSAVPSGQNADIIVGLLYEHTNSEPVVLQKSDEKATLPVFPEGKAVKKNVIHCDPLKCGWVRM